VKIGVIRGPYICVIRGSFLSFYSRSLAPNPPPIRGPVL